MLKIDDLHVRYGRVAALRGVSLNVQRGEIVALIGPNGAGKTTTLASIFGLVVPKQGSISFEGQSLLRRQPEQIARLGLSLVPEGRRIFGSLTVGENLHLGGTASDDRATFGKDRKRIFELLPVLERYADTPAGRLSGGEQQQLAIARALLSRPRLLLLDEPSLGLAPMIIDRVFDTLAEIREAGTTILLVEQNAAKSAVFADRTYVLRGGKVTLSGTREEIAAHADFATVYLGV